MAAVLRTHVGKVRKQNEDAAFLDEKLGVFAVADGMGGHLAGEVASAMAIEAIRAAAQAQDLTDEGALRRAVGAAHEAIAERARTNAGCSGMGTTLSVMQRGAGAMHIAQVGDSRIYRMREGSLELITQDHSLVEELVRSGLITPEEARVHPRRNIITRALGTQGDNTPDLLTAKTRRGDLWLVCSDGLNSMISDEEIAAQMRRVGTAQDLAAAADALIDCALEAGGRDNVTLILYMEEEA